MFYRPVRKTGRSIDYSEMMNESSSSSSSSSSSKGVSYPLIHSPRTPKAMGVYTVDGNRIQTLSRPNHFPKINQFGRSLPESFRNGKVKHSQSTKLSAGTHRPQYQQQHQQQYQQMGLPLARKIAYADTAFSEMMQSGGLEDTLTSTGAGTAGTVDNDAAGTDVSSSMMSSSERSSNSRFMPSLQTAVMEINQAHSPKVQRKRMPFNNRRISKPVNPLKLSIETTATAVSEGYAVDLDYQPPSSEYDKKTAEESNTVKFSSISSGGELPSGLKVDSIEYLSSEDIAPIDGINPKALNKIVQELESQDWPDIFATVNKIRSIALHHSALLSQHGVLHTVVNALAKHVDSLRSALAKNSLLAIGDLFKGLSHTKAMDLEVSALLLGLLKVMTRQ
jgi:hypothetical protein